MPLQLDTPVIDLIFAADAQPTPEQVVEALGGEAAAATRMVLDVDLDAPQYEMEVSPTVPLRRRGERRILIVDEAATPMRKSPRTEPIVPRDLRPEKERLVALVEKTGARLGRLGAFGAWGDAVIVTRSPRDLRAILLLGWALDPQTDVDGRRRATPLTQREFEQKLAAYDRRLDELDDAAILARVPPASLTRRGTLYVVDLLSDRDGSWDLRKSYELEKQLSAVELFARIPGAKVTIADEPTQPGTPPPAPPAPPAAAPSPPAPPPPAGPPIGVELVEGRPVLRIPAERFDLDGVTALGRRNLDILRVDDPVGGRERDLIHQHGCDFVAPLAFLSEVFLEGKPLDRKRFEAEAQDAGGGVRSLEAHLPRFGPVRVLDAGGKRFVTSDLRTDVGRLVEIARRINP